MDDEGLHPGWWTLLLVTLLAVSVWLTYALFTGTLTSTVPVTLTSDRASLVMEYNAKVKLRGVQVGRVADISVTGQESPPVALRLEIDPDKLQFIPANIEAQIRATTIFGAKFVDLVFPDSPSNPAARSGTGTAVPQRDRRGIAVFPNLVAVLDQVDAGQTQQHAVGPGRRRRRSGRADRPGDHRRRRGSAGAESAQRGHHEPICGPCNSFRRVQRCGPRHPVDAERGEHHQHHRGRTSPKTWMRC